MTSNYLSPYIERGRIIVRYEHKGDEGEARGMLLEKMKEAGVSGRVHHLPVTQCSGCNDPRCKLGGDGYWFADLSPTH